MRVLVTGGTGFVGSHSVAALVAAGHDVRMLVRDRSRVAAALNPHGLGPDAVEVAAGDVTDTDAVARAMDGSDALLHGASVFSLDPRDAENMRRVNVDGARTVLESAVERGLDPIVHVSSVLALAREGVREQHYHVDAPVGDRRDAYAASKAAQEALARSLQASGAPVVITYPGGVFGPHDPYLGESARIARNTIRGMYFFCTRGSLPVVDVRDVAAIHAAVMEPEEGPRRFLAGGHAVDLREVIAKIAAADGKRRPTVPLPDGLALAIGRLADMIQRVSPWRLPLSREAVVTGVTRISMDNGTTEQELGVTFRPPDETIRDQVAWQRAAGKL